MKGCGIYIWAVVLAVISIVALGQGCFRSAFWITDSFQYMRCAENLKTVCSGGQWVGGWFGTWPVGYPVALALVSGLTGLDVFIASKVVSMLATAGLLWLFWHYSRKHFPILALSLLNLAYLKIFRGTLSEQLFIPILVWLGFAVRQILLAREDFRWCTVLKLAILFVGLFTVRYVGVFAPLWVLCGVWLWWFAQRGRGVTRSILGLLLVMGCASAIAWGVEGLYLGLNWWKTGHLTGMPRDTLLVPFAQSFRDIVMAEFHELQAFGLAIFWGVLLLVLARRRQRLAGGSSCRSREWLVFVGMGLAYHLTIAFVRIKGGCSELGFRFLYPGTILLVIGLILFAAQRFSPDWHVGGKSLVALVLVVVCVGTSLLDLELFVRRQLGIATYGIGRPYREIRAELLEKYKNVPSGSVLHLKGLVDEDLPIIFLRPDLDFDFPKGARRY